MKKYFLIAFVLLRFAPALGQLIYSDNFIYSSSRLLFIPVKINNIKTLALVDLGSYKGVAISSKLADSLNLSLTGTNNNSVRYTGSSKEFQTNVDSFILGNLHVKQQLVSVVPNDIEKISKQVKTEFGAILGWGLLSKYFIRVNYQKKEILISMNEPLGEMLPLLTLNYQDSAKVPVINTNIEGKNCKMLFDTGAPFCNLHSGLDSSNINTIVSKEVLLSKKKFYLNFRIKDLSVIKNSLGCEGVIGNNFLEKYEVSIFPKSKIITLR